MITNSGAQVTHPSLLSTGVPMTAITIKPVEATQ
jgi:hypothetical protein